MQRTAEYRFHDAAGRDRKSEDLAEWRHRDLSVKLGELPASKEEAMNHNEGASKEALEA